MAQQQRGTGPADRGRAAKALPVRVAGEPEKGPRDDPQPEAARQSNYAGWRRGDEEDIVDAEIIDEADPANSSDARWQHLRDRAREFFGAKTREQMRERDRRRMNEQERAAADGDGLDEREYLLKLRVETRLAGEQYMQSLRDCQVLVPGFNDEEREQEFNVMHHIYMQMMMQACLKPLTRGVNPHSILQAAGMMVTMRMLSPDFRTEMDTYLQPLKDKVQERIDARTTSVTSFAERQADRHNTLLEARTKETLERRPELVDDEGFMRRQEAKKNDRNTYLSKKWQRRMENMQRRERGNREMFTPQSAAMTEIALAENAFWKMRDPAYDSNEIYASYRAMRKRLRTQMGEDGLERQEVVTRARTIIGERMESEPELRLMFNGMAHGRIVKAPPHARQMTGSDQVREVWNGQFNDQLGRRIPEDAMLTLRRPMDADAHQVQVAETMATSMLYSLQHDNQEAYAGSIMGYLVGFAVKKEGLDTRGLPEVLQQRMDQSESMLASMDIDGLTAQKQQEVYSNAFTDAMEDVGRQHPGVEQALRTTFGTDWQASLQAAVDDPARFVHQQRARSMSYRVGRDRSAQQSAGFDWGYSARASDPGEYQPA